LYRYSEALLVAAPPEVEREDIGRYVTKLAKTTRFALYAAPRATAAPRLRIRRAKVGGAARVESSLTHSLKPPGSNP
jgi:hypothetical protein